MSCKKHYCPEGMELCCKDCIKEATDFCETVCGGAKQKECKNYHDEDKERRKKKKDRKTARWALLILALALLLFGAALTQTWKAAYIGEVEKQTVNMESGIRTGRG